ncbi:MAG: maleylpyruvate isomerase N-terminal domain-containing protein, partial [Actinomycetota bacterium]
MPDLASLREDLRAEHDELDRSLASLTDREWDEPTPAPGWSVRDQISHLAFFDEEATLA